MRRFFLVQLGVNFIGYEIIDENGSVTVEGWLLGAFFLAVICAIIYFVVQETRMTKQGVNSAEKQRIAQIIAEVSNNEAVTPAYAFWSTQEHQFNSRKITHYYWWYAIGFSKERIYVVPIQISDTTPRNITYQNFLAIEPDQLGLVNGKKNSNWMELYDKEGNKIVSLRVWSSVTASSVSDHRINVNQKEAAEVWQKEIVPYWMERVNTANNRQATGFTNNAKALDFSGKNANIHGGGKAKNF